MATVTRPRVEQTRPGQLVEWAQSGRLRVPYFQRSYRWERDDVVKLFDSILRGYPIGNLLMWQRPADAAVLEVGPLAVTAPQVPDALWVVDGQQRITSLVGALAAPADTVDPRFRIFYDLRQDTFVSAGRREDVPGHWLPVPVSLSNVSVLAWQRERSWLTDLDIARCDAVVTSIRDYSIPMYVVEGDDEQALRVIFDRLNNFGRRLTQAEIFNALHTVSGQMEPSGLAALAANVKGFGFGEIPERVLMQSVLAIRGGRIDRDFRGEFSDDTDRHEAFKRTEHALGIAIDFLRDEAAIPHVRLLPYMLFLPILARFVELFGPPEGRAAELLRRWVWRGSVLGVAPQGNTVALRKNGLAVEDDPVMSADQLLRLLPPGGAPWRPALGAVRLNQAQAKVNLLGMLSRRPRVLVAPFGAEDRVGTAVDPTWLMDQGWNPLIPIMSDGGGLEETVANRLVHPMDVAAWDVLSALDDVDFGAEILESHFIDNRGLRLYRQNEQEKFVAYRAVLVETAIVEHVQENALFTFPDGPELFRPDYTE
ncbi:DUF262 domain-containing protein [Planotetraspora sp. GP83]|uniref:DUF262 domain-containing protein n=1 Tax=Planotetraspora sp. GP83 TaxID=3156264 RepID=UPI0035157254